MGGIEDIRAFVAAAKAEREQSGDARVRPSDAWRHGLTSLRYVLKLDAEELERIRHHTFIFTGDNFQIYEYGADDLRNDVVGGVLACFARLGSFHIDETERGIGFRTEQGVFSTDLFRYLRALCDLVECGRLGRDTPMAMLEIGGGYGGMARIVTAYNPHCSYTIVDLEEMVFCSAVYLRMMLGDDRVHLIDAPLRDGDLRAGHVYLVPQCRLDRVEACFDLALNDQSMQEMTAPQVARYCDFLAEHAAFFYSRNLPTLRAYDDQVGFLKQFELVADVGRTLAERFHSVWVGPQNTAHETERNIRRVLYSTTPRSHNADALEMEPRDISRLRRFLPVSFRSLAQKLRQLLVRSSHNRA